MSQDRNRLIAELASDLPPVQHPGNTHLMLFAWVIFMSALGATFMFSTGDLRANPIDELLSSTQFAIETFVGIGVIIAFASAALKASIPSTEHPARSALVALGLFGLWLAIMVYGLSESALPASMQGKRDSCWLDTLLLGIPGVLVGIYAVNRLWPLRRAWVGAWIGASAGAVPALLMQFGCMYIPAHNLQHHLLPGALVVPVGAVLGALLIRRRS